MMTYLVRSGVVLVLLQVSCGGRSAPLPDAATDGPAPWDSSGGDRRAPDQQPARDGPVSPDLFAALFIDQLFADCMPSVPPDPVNLSGHAELLNNGTIAVGPLQLGGGRLLGATGGELGTFDVKPITPFVIKPGEGLSPKVEKVPGSLKPTGACGLCGKPIRVEIAYSGAGIPAGAKIVSSEVPLSCAY